MRYNGVCLPLLGPAQVMQTEEQSLCPTGSHFSDEASKSAGPEDHSFAWPVNRHSRLDRKTRVIGATIRKLGAKKVSDTSVEEPK